VQLVIAGKAHPRDAEGKASLQAWVSFVRRSDVRTRAVFLADYDLRVAERLVQGVDVWLNTPRPPWEACGTSGMKVLVNGGINLSSLDGWWAEAYEPEVGYALRDADGDAGDAAGLYDVLEREVIPTFYDRDAAGLPARWVGMVRASMTRLAPTYSANRALREYTENYYLPAAGAYARRSAEGGARAAAIVEWAHTLRSSWPAVRFGETRVRTEGGRHHFAVTVYLGGIDPARIVVELIADPVAQPGADLRAERVPMVRDGALIGAHGFVFQASVPDARPATHYTPRVVPAHPDAAVPMDLPLVVWP
jgi:starch phosphorylase